MYKSNAFLWDIQSVRVNIVLMRNERRKIKTPTKKTHIFNISDVILVYNDSLFDNIAVLFIVRTIIDLITKH